MSDEGAILLILFLVVIIWIAFDAILEDWRP